MEIGLRSGAMSEIPRIAIRTEEKFEANGTVLLHAVLHTPVVVLRHSTQGPSAAAA